MSKEIVLTEKWQMIKFATDHGAKVTNDKGEKVVASKEPYPDAVKCYVSFPYYYLSSAEKQDSLYFDDMTYDEWHSKKVFDLTESK